MYLIILFSAITVLSFIAAVKLESWFYSIANAFILIVMVLSLVDRKSDFRAIKTDYETTKVLIESYSGTDYGNMAQIVNHVVDINCTIAKHKAYSTSKWCGIWFSEEIGALEPLLIKK